jgi:hypothetical protein
MLSSKRCPYTGVVNFYAASDPHMAVGSIARCGTAIEVTDGFTWRCYAGESLSAGHAPDLKTAERRLTNFYAMVATLPDPALRLA